MKSNIRMLIAAILVVAVDSFYLKMVKGHWEHQVKSVQKSAKQINLTGAALSYIFIIISIKAYIGLQLFNEKIFTEIINKEDDFLKRALELIKSSYEI